MDKHPVINAGAASSHGRRGNNDGSDNDISAKPEKLNRPGISKGCTSEDWGYFSSIWTSYKTATKLSGHDAKTQLLACCDAELRRDLHGTDKLIENKTEADIMKAVL